jgi:hypothetical protein
VSLSSCVFCGAPGVVPVVFPETFTAYQLLQTGDQARFVTFFDQEFEKFGSRT